MVWLLEKEEIPRTGKDLEKNLLYIPSGNVYWYNDSENH